MLDIGINNTAKAVWLQINNWTDQTTSWVSSVSIGVGLTGTWLSWRYREPIITSPSQGWVRSSWPHWCPCLQCGNVVAICTGKDAHKDPSKRYISELVCGVLYITVGIFGVTLVTLLMVLPRTFITTQAGLALLGAIGGSLANARTRETALITFLATSRQRHPAGCGRCVLGAGMAGLIVHLLIHGGTKALIETATAK